MANLSVLNLPNNSSYNLKDNSGTQSAHLHNWTQMQPTITKTYSNIIATANTNEAANFLFMSVKPNSWYEPWTVWFKVHTWCPAYPSYNNVTYSTVSGRTDNFVYANWNEGYNAAHYYFGLYCLKQAGFNAGLGHAIGVNLISAGYNTNSNYHRTIQIEYYKCEGCTVTLLDTPVLYNDWPNYNTTNYNGLSNLNAVSRGLQESGDANDRAYTVSHYYSRIKTGAVGLGRYTFFMEAADGTYQSIVQSTNDSPFGSTNTKHEPNTIQFRPERIFYRDASSEIAANVTNNSANAWMCQQYGLVDCRYSFNCAQTLVAYKPLYLVGTINDAGLFTLSVTTTNNIKYWYAQDLPTTEDGKYYIYLGTVYNDTNPYRIQFELDNPIYYYKDSAIRVYGQDGRSIKSITRNGTTFTVTRDNGSSFNFTQQDNNTTYTFENGTNGFKVTPSGGTAQTVTVTPSITNNITGSGTSGYLTKFNGTNTITNGPQLGSSTTTFLRNDGTWAAPSGSVTGVKGSSETNYRTGNVNLTAANIGLGNVNNTSDATKQIYEANLLWGGKNFAASYSPIDAAMIDELGANRLAFVKTEGITIEYSRDNGSTWIDYDDDTYKVSLFASGRNYYIGKADSTNKATANGTKYQLRVTINSELGRFYTTLNKFAIYVTTNGSSNCTVTIEKALKSSPSSYITHIADVPLSGWSGWNIINIDPLTTYGNSQNSQYVNIRFIFKANGGDTNYPGLGITKIKGFGGVGWTTPSTMAQTGHLYSYDQNQNATFPAKVTADSFTGSGASLTNLNANNLSSGTVADARLSSNVILLNNAQTISGQKTFSNDIFLTTPDATSPRQVRWTVGANDYARITAGATGSNAGWFEIATADDGNEPIYVRQYSGLFATLKRTATLLDASGNTEFPVKVTAPKFLAQHVSGGSGEFRIIYDDTIDYWWGVGTGDINHGMFDQKANKWIISADAGNNWSFNGTATTATNLASNPSLAASNNQINVTAGGKTSSNFTVPYATATSRINSNNELTYGWSGINYFNHISYPSSTVKVNDAPTGTSDAKVWWHILRFNHANNSGYYTDLAIPFNANSIYWKRITGGSIQNSTINSGWIKVLDQLNYTDYTVKKDGTGATGTWDITATTATNLASAPSLAASGNNITVSAGGKTSSAFTVPYAAKAAATNISTTKDAIAKYSDTTGTFSNSNVTIDANGNINFPTASHGSFMPSHFYHREYNNSHYIYVHFYDQTISGKYNSGAEFRVKTDEENKTYKTLIFRGDGIFQWDGQNIAHYGNVSTGDSNGQVKIAGKNITVKGISDLAYISKPSSNQTTTWLRGDGSWQSAPVTSVAGNTGAITADTLRTSLGLSNAMHFRGIATVAITDGSTTNPTISGYDWSTKAAGDVIIDKDSSYEYVWSGSKWERLGPDGSYKTVQTAKSDPTASGTSNSFISTISQDANGVITATKANLPIELGAYAGGLNTNGWKNLGARTSGSKVYIAYNSSPADWNAKTYSSSLVFGCADTKGLIDISHDTPIVSFGGSSVSNSTDNAPKWYFKLSATAGKTYTLPSDSKTLAATDGTGASGTWGINITGKATKDSDGNTINTTYVKLSGSTMTGALLPVGKNDFIAYPSDGGMDLSGDRTGYIKIKIPQTKTATMFSFDIDIYDYRELKSSTRYHIAGYNFTDASWNRMTAYCIAPLSNPKGNLTVRFLSNGNDLMYICIGETNTTWSYPKAIIHNIMIKHSAANATNYTNWASGWVVTLENTAFDNSQLKYTIENTNIAYTSNETLNATKATSANITSTAYGVAYYSNTTGQFASTSAGTSGYLLQGNGSAAPSWIQATNSNTASTIVKRDSSGNFSAGTITATLSGNATSANYPYGFTSRSASASWGNTTGTCITSWNGGDGCEIAFFKNNPDSGKLSIKLDGTIYIKEGGQNIAEAVKEFSVSGQTVTYTTLWGNTGTFTTQDTKNTAGSTNSTSKLFLIGATTQAANPTTNSYQYTYTNNGLLSATKLGLNASGTEKVHMEWNATDLSLDFIFD